MRYRVALLLCLALGLCRSVSAQPPPPAPRFEPQTINLLARYRVIESSAKEVTADQVQFKDVFRAAFNLDRDRRFSIHVGASSGSSFTSSWDATGIGSGDASANMYVKQLYGAVAPIRGLELQFGGLYVNHGENTEITSYDDDGYLMGERLTLRRPAQAYFDEVSVTRAALGPLSAPGVVGRLSLLGHQHYWQAQVVKHYGPRFSASADFTDAAGAETLRAAVALHFPNGAPVSALRYEQYRRVTVAPANGFALIAERPIARVLLQAGYADIDAQYGGLNADRFQRGRRVFAMVTIPISGPLSAQLFATQALTSEYPISNRRRFDAVVTYDVLAALRRNRAN